MTLFLVIDLVLWIFPFFSHIFRIFTMLNVVYDHFLTRKTPFFTLFILSRTSDNTTSQNIGGGPMHGPSPHLKFWGDRPPQSPPRSPPLPAHLKQQSYQKMLCFGLSLDKKVAIWALTEPWSQVKGHTETGSFTRDSVRSLHYR